ncbi:MAG: hypothetical protein ACLQVY_01835 [Limisphaerales bacterium]
MPGTVLKVKGESSSRFSWLLPAGLAAAIIVLYSMAVISRSPKPSGLASSTQSNAAASAAISLVAKPSGLDLVGSVTDSEGQPVPKATIFIYTAQPRSGPGFL